MCRPGLLSKLLGSENHMPTPDLNLNELLTTTSKGAERDNAAYRNYFMNFYTSLLQAGLYLNVQFPSS